MCYPDDPLTELMKLIHHHRYPDSLSGFVKGGLFISCLSLLKHAS